MGRSLRRRIRWTDRVRKEDDGGVEEEEVPSPEKKPQKPHGKVGCHFKFQHRKISNMGFI